MSQARLVNSFGRPKAPNMYNFFVFETCDIDVPGLIIAQSNFKRQRAQFDMQPTPKTKRPFMTRNTYAKKAPRTSDWYTDYVVDAGETWRDESHRDGKC